MESSVGLIGLVGRSSSSACGSPLRVMTSVLRRSRPLIVSGLFVLAGTPAAPGQPTEHRSINDAFAVAIVNVNLIRMDRERVEPGPTVIDSAGHYLVPGLTDAHVHLPGFLPGLTREDFGDAPLYLAHGVTTVVN